MSKKKRIRRDIEKHFRLGRYWELLRLLESEELLSANPNEYKESWKAVIRDALRHQLKFDEFCREIDTVKSRPEDPGFRFLMLLKGYMEGSNTADQVIELTGLPPDAEKLKSNFAAFVSAFQSSDKIRAALKKFIREPEKITGRHYEQLAKMLPVKLGRELAGLGILISEARNLNRKNVASRGWDGISIPDVAGLDDDVDFHTSPIPPALTEIFVHPVVHNVALMCQRLAPEATTNLASELLGSMPFLLPRLAGEKLRELEQRLPEVRTRPDTEEDVDRADYLAWKTDKLSLEEKLTLLAKMRIKIRESQPDEVGGWDADTFEDEDDWEEEDEDLPGAPSLEIRRRAAQILALHRSILGDISGRLLTLPQRDRKELVRVMEPILMEDLDIFRDLIENAQDIMDLLDASMSADCAGVRIGLLTLLMASHYRNGDLRRRAERYLDQLAPPTQQDMIWLAKEGNEFFYPKARSLKYLLLRYGQEKDLLKFFSLQLCRNLEFSFYENLVFSDLSALVPGEKAAEPREPGILRRELEALSEYRTFDVVRDFLRCYPNNCLTIDGHLCWYNAIHASYAEEGAWEVILRDLQRGTSLEEDMGGSLDGMDSIGKLVTDRVEAALFFMMEHSGEIAKLRLDILEPMLDELSRYIKVLRGHTPILIRLEKTIVARVEAGDAAAGAAMDKIRQIMQKTAKTGARKHSKRKHRR